MKSVLMPACSSPLKKREDFTEEGLLRVLKLLKDGKKCGN